MRRLICTFVVHIWHKQVFSWSGPFYLQQPRLWALLIRRQDIYWGKLLPVKILISFDLIAFNKIPWCPFFLSIFPERKILKFPNWYANFDQRQRENANLKISVVACASWHLGQWGSIGLNRKMQILEPVGNKFLNVENPKKLNQIPHWVMAIWLFSLQYSKYGHLRERC